MRFTFSILVLAALSACAPAVPDSGAGVGFDDYGTYLKEKQARDAQLSGNALPAPDAISEEALDDGFIPVKGEGDPVSDAADVAADTQAALDETAANSGEPVVHADPSNPAPETVLSATGISQENDFQAVGAERSIEDDAVLIAQNRAQYKVIQPTALPTRSGSSGPNIVDYALQTTQVPGAQLYRRVGLNKQARFLRNCAKYASPDRAQEDFLAKGGPDRDRLGIDPDGDGFACTWDPRPFRRAVNG